ncbi:hypothetical protein AKJ47_03270 [candidate division MSBL1 archaeon SCGC-AAA261G05]|uniref:Uncharacterized protein n=3 Tax=candidate division MSBL1 TaxID=215777 RepID=A0A133V1P4_9EURY|nr:hypothetical protein AKJ42_01015 [candidate division MSBL1 archaeon SCGC-AAA261C02]KXB02708.1 hypothetical protein AKJ47_03270 [candidate division MSBL1 archaeon SCGC-AAA261G05]KXB03871.1 hypothetical protein AKJ48_03595 [candidate division MSBL1 archaeon SCGC-AAA261O19]
MRERTVTEKIIAAAKYGQRLYIRRRGSHEHITAYDPASKKVKHLGSIDVKEPSFARNIVRVEQSMEEVREFLEGENIKSRLHSAKERGSALSYAQARSSSTGAGYVGWTPECETTTERYGSAPRSICSSCGKKGVLLFQPGFSTANGNRRAWDDLAMR